MYILRERVETKERKIQADDDDDDDDDELFLWYG